MKPKFGQDFEADGVCSRFETEVWSLLWRWNLVDISKLSQTCAGMNASLLTMELHVNFPPLLQDFVWVFGDDNDDMIYNVVNVQFMVLLQHVISSYSPVKSSFVNLSQTSRKKRKAKTEILQTSWSQNMVKILKLMEFAQDLRLKFDPYFACDPHLQHIWKAVRSPMATTAKLRTKTFWAQ